MSYREHFTGKRKDDFYAKIGPLQPNGQCRLWLGMAGRDERAVAWLPDGTRPCASRVLWELENPDQPPLEPHEDIEHICHDPLCMSISCLRRSTRLENMQRSVRDGRMPRGRANGAHLSETQVHMIRTRAKLDIYGDLAKMARELGVHKQVVKDVVYRYTWKWLPEPVVKPKGGG